MTTPPLTTLSNAAGTIAAFHAAVRLGILDRIDREPATIEQIATTCGTSRRGTTLLIAALSASGLVEQLADDRYRPIATGQALAALHPLLDLWRHLPESIRNGQPPLHADTATGSGQLYPRVVAHLAGMSAAAATRAAQLLPPAVDILDVGAGAAPWSLALAARNPECQITGLDLTAVLPITRQAVGRAGCIERFRFLAGDAFEVELPQQAYDLILLAHFCHLFDDDRNRRLLERLTASLRSSGTLAIIDLIPRGARSTSLALYELGLFLRTGTGKAHPLSAYQQWLSDVGFAPDSPIDVSDQPPITLLTAHARPTTGAAARSRSLGDDHADNRATHHRH